MKEKFELIPHKGVVWNKKNIDLSFTKRQVKDVLGEPESEFGERYYYFDNSLQISFDGEGKVEYIEFAGGSEWTVEPFIYGINVFNTDADEVVKILKKKIGGKTEEEDGYSYVFLNSDVSVWREVLPDDEDDEEERKLASLWWSIGIGVKGYYS